MIDAWQPLKRMDNDPDWEANPKIAEARGKYGLDLTDDEVWLNDEFQVTVRYLKPVVEDMPHGQEGMLHLSIHRRDRHRVRDWRIMQQIKNEVAGPEREAVEIFPSESRLVDTSNEYHLWVLPAGVSLPFGFADSAVSSDEQVDGYNEMRRRGRHKGRQHPWRPGLTTGRTDHSKVLPDEHAKDLGFLPDDMDTSDGLGG